MVDLILKFYDLPRVAELNNLGLRVVYSWSIFLLLSSN